MGFDSSQAGYLQPNFISVLEDQALASFLQGIVAGITGLPGKRVVQRWQPEPPTPPEFSIDWAAVGEQGDRERDTFVNIIHKDGENILYRNEILTVLVSFYGPHSRANAGILAQGFQIAQNRETMVLNGYGFIESLNPVITADLVHERWRPRVDLSFRVRRSVVYRYTILDLLGSKVTVNVDGAQKSFNITLQLPMFAWGPEGDFVAGWGSGNWTELK
jgi:hypothetical protein